MINVRDFGATSDGSTDDLPVFEAALAELPVYPLGSTGTIVFSPPGVYRLTRKLKIMREMHLLGGGGAAGHTGVMELNMDIQPSIIFHPTGTKPFTPVPHNPQAPMCPR